MKLLIIHAKSFHISSVKKSTRPGDIVSIDNLGGKLTLKDCLVVFTTIEPTDTSVSAQQAADAIYKVFASVRNASTSLAIIPFAHLTDSLAKPDIAYERISEIYHILSTNNSDAYVVLGDFGFNNEWGLDAHSHPLSCVYRQT